ncbi:MAG: hypothetical protein KZQ94_05860 [Candidatus Thiodiazotropha sp. (ex Troendleina suluensis)]|nr:hypothetical protein [Candidatus Thiodiazotropha sp. (ex Troendleina suluensis)]
MPRKRTAIETALKAKGFMQEACAHHDKYMYYVDDKFTGVHTRISRGSKYRDYSDNLLSKMKKQLKLNSSSELLALIDCPMTKEQYKQILHEKDLF